MTQKQYEGLFIVNPSLTMGESSAEEASTEEGTKTEAKAVETVETVVEALLTKVGASIKETIAWGNRKLAYTIDKQSRGNYYLVYFTSEPGKIVELNRQVTLSDQIMRVMVSDDTNGDLKAKFERLMEEAAQGATAPVRS